MWHSGFIYKLHKCGFKAKLLAWFMDYLKDSIQRVIIKVQYSEWAKDLAKVPQGSVFGPLLFLIFNNDRTNIITCCNIRMFADDTWLFITVDNRGEAAKALNHDLVKIQSWPEQWLMMFSPPKTESLIISNKKNIDMHSTLYLNHMPIKEVNFHKHLGITLTQSLR